MDRQKTLEINKSIRTIKQELENLLGHGVLSESAFESISAQLPAEGSLSASAAPAAAAVAAPPPSYAQTPAPALPQRAGPPPLAVARALYAYNGPQANDLSFAKDDRIEVSQYVNPDWWAGRNARTGQEGLFPSNYVLVENDKGFTPAPAPAQQYGGYAAPAPVQQNPYNAAVPPMAVAEESKESGGKSKLEEGGKKFGKKLGNAAIFGAGATIGSNLINSIF